MFNLHVKLKKRMTNVIFYSFSDVIFIRQQFKFGFQCDETTLNTIFKALTVIMGRLKQNQFQLFKFYRKYSCF